VEQRVQDLDQRVTTMADVGPNVIRLTEQVNTLRRDLRSYSEQVGKLDGEIQHREAATRKERREARRAMWSLTVMIFVGLLGATAAVLTAVIH
jgi:t-SNARE complex subunit (syntaxin)